MKYNFFSTNIKTRVLTFILVEAVMFIIASALVTIASKIFTTLPQHTLLLITLALQGLVLFVAAPLITARLITTTPFKYLSLTTLPSARQIIWVTLAMITMLPALNLIVSWNEGLHLPQFMSGIEEWMRAQEEAAAEATKQLLAIKTIPALIATILMVGVLTGIGEELTFRGVLQKLINEKWVNPHIAIWVAAIIFSAIHIQFFGFFPRMLLGAFFGYLLVWSKSIWLPIYAHFLNNTMATIAAYMLNTELTTDQIEKVGTIDNGTLWTAIVSLLLFSICAIKIKKSK